jgi:phospholipid/cholesterol/gamma-HCH transport system substrate-binding protein
MKARPAEKIKIGMFTIAGLLLLSAGLFMIGSGQSLFTKTFKLNGDFRNIGGLTKGNIVRFNGMNVGTIEDISMVTDSTVRVRMNIRAKYQQFIKSDAIAGIGSDGLMGDKLIVITPGHGVSASVVSNGGIIHTSDPLDFDKSLAKVDRIASNLEVMSGSLAQITTQVSSGKGTIGKLLYDDKLSNGLENTVQGFENTMSEARLTIGAVHRTVNTINGTLASAGTAVESVKDAITEAKHTFSAAHNTVATLDGTLKSAGSAVVAVRNAVDSAATAAKGALRSAQDGAEGFKDNMDAIKHSFLLKGYFRKRGDTGFGRKKDTRYARKHAPQTKDEPKVRPEEDTNNSTKDAVATDH